MEEIISLWDSPFALVLELGTPEVGPEGQRNPLKKVRELMSQPSAEGEDFNFRLEDADGKPVKFPLRLISDTTFDRE